MEQEITITLTASEMDQVGNVLAQRPYGEVANLLAKMQGQINAQQNPPEDPPKE